MLIIGSCKALYLFSLIILQLAADAGVQALPTKRHSPARHNIRYGHGGRTTSSPPVIDHHARQAYLKRRRSAMPLVSSRPPAELSSEPSVHHIDRLYLPQDITAVQHVILAKRHRSHKSHLPDDKQEDDHSGHDTKGYDDGSWGGDDGDYGSKEGRGMHQKDEEARKEEGNESGEDRGKTAKQKDTDEAGKGDAEDLKPKGKIKVKGGGDNDGNADREDDDTSAATANKASSLAATSTAENEANSTSSASTTPASRIKTTKSKVVDGGAESDESEPQEDASSASTRRASDEESTGECAALQKIFNEMSGADWIGKDGWKDLGDKCCSAHGVSCNDAGQIFALDLPSNGLAGALSPSIFELKSLTRL